MLHTCQPFTVDVFPPVVFDLLELEQDGVEGSRFQPLDFDLDQREHSPSPFGDNHLIGLVVESLPQLRVFQLDGDGAVRPRASRNQVIHFVNVGRSTTHNLTIHSFLYN